MCGRGSSDAVVDGEEVGFAEVDAWGVGVDLAGRSAEVHCDVGRVPVEELVAAVSAAGYGADLAT